MTVGWLRACIRIPAIFLLLAGLIVINRTAWLFCGRDPMSRYRVNKRGTRFISTWLGRAIGMRLKIVGAPPPEPYILVCNHLGYMDIVAICNVAASVFIAKSEVSSWPFIGTMVRSTNIEFVDRVNHRDLQRVNQIAAESTRIGRGVIFFPEGTSSSGRTVLPFRPSLLEHAASSGLPVHCASIHYETPAGAPPASNVVAWWGDMDFFTHLFHLARVPYFKATLVFAPEPIRADNRKTLAALLHQACLDIFTPTDRTPDGHDLPPPPRS